MKDIKREITMADQLVTYQIHLKQMAVITQELHDIGYIPTPDFDRWDRLILSERARVGLTLHSMKVSALSRLPSIDAAKAVLDP